MSKKKSKEEEQEARSLAPRRIFGDLEPWPRLFRERPFSSRFPRLLDDLFQEWSAGSDTQPLLPAIDVSDDDKRYSITVELPGCNKDDVHVELQEGMLTIRGEKKNEREEKKENRRYVERSYGSFTRALRLPQDADAENMDASFKDGVLTVEIPKSEEAKPRTIAIKS
jgi:HSP20 family protein